MSLIVSLGVSWGSSGGSPWPLTGALLASLILFGSLGALLASLICFCSSILFSYSRFGPREGFHRLPRTRAIISGRTMPQTEPRGPKSAPKLCF